MRWTLDNIHKDLATKTVMAAYFTMTSSMTRETVTPVPVPLPPVTGELCLCHLVAGPQRRRVCKMGRNRTGEGNMVISKRKKRLANFFVAVIFLFFNSSTKKTGFFFFKQ